MMAQSSGADLPDWLTLDNGVFLIDSDIIYPELLKELGVNEDEIDQYWLEVVYQCAKLETQRLLFNTSFDTRPNGKSLLFSVRSADKERWALKNHRRGRGAEVATKGREARGHYIKLRGYIPG